MAVQMIEGFEGGSAFVCDIFKNGLVLHTSQAPGSAGPWSTYFFSGNGQKSLKSPVGELYAAFRYYCTGAATILVFRDAGGGQMFRINISAGALIQAVDANNTTVATGTTAMAFSAWHLIECHVIVGNSGTVEIRLDGSTTNEITMSGTIDTQSGTPTTISYIDMGSGVDFDDVIIYDTTGSNWNSWVGDKGVAACYPNAVGSANDMLPDGKSGASTSRWYMPRIDVVLGQQYPSGYISALPGLAPDASWEVLGSVSGGVVYKGELADQKRASAISTHNNGFGSSEVYTATANQDVLVMQYVSPELAAQTISGTFKCYIMARNGSGTEDVRSQIVIRVVSADGSTVRGVLYAGDTATSGANPPSEWSTTLTNQGFPRAGLLPASLSSLAISEGDRLVVEIGFRTHAGCTNSDVRWIIGDDQTTDLAENETNTGTGFNPWIEFSNAMTLSQQGNFDYVNEPVSPAGLSNNDNDPYSFPADRDSSFVSASVDNARDLYNLTNVASSFGTSGPIVIKSYAKKQDTGSRKFAHAYKTSGAEQTTADVLLATSWAYKETFLDVDGTDSAVWTDAKVNSLQVGPKARP